MRKTSKLNLESNKQQRKRNQQNIAFVMGIVGIILITLIGGSYAFFSIVVGGNKKVTVEVGTFEVSFVDHDIITLENTYPVSDAKGMTNSSYNFTVKNTGTVNALYDLSLEEQGVSPNTLNKKYIKYSIKEGTGEWSSPKLLSELNNLVLVSGKSLGSSSGVDYSIKLWLDYNAGNEAQGKEFKARLVLNAVQGNATTNDTTPPEIKLAGGLSLNIKQGSVFTDPGVDKVTDDKDTLNKANVTKTYEYYDGSTTISTSFVDTTKLGIYYIYYRISDLSGNEGVIVRTVNVYKPDTNAPVMILNGANPQTIELGETYTELGATAIDPEEGDLSHNIVVEGTVNTNLEGTYMIKYLITDQSGNTSSITRTVIVKEVVYILQAGASGSITNYYKYRTEITQVEFKQGTEIPGNAIENWEVQDATSEGVIQAYIVDDGLGTNTYKLYIQSKGKKIYANPGSSYLFYNFSKVTEINHVNYLNTSKVTLMSSMFYNCKGLSSINLSSFDTTNVTSLSSMFYGCSSLTVLDLSGFDTSKVTTMYQMFVSCSSLMTLDLSNFNTGKVTTIDAMFYGCSSLTTLDVNHFDTSKVTTMHQLFYGCSNIASLDLSNFNTSSVSTMANMFAGCTKLESLNLSNFNTSKVTTMQNMFQSCSNITSIDLSSFDTGKVTNMSYMFQSCSSLTSIDLSSFDTGKVTNMSYMFQSCSGITSLNLTSFDTSKVTTMVYMFRYTDEMQQIRVSSTWSMAPTVTGMFTSSGVAGVTYA